MQFSETRGTYCLPVKPRRPVVMSDRDANGLAIPAFLITALIAISRTAWRRGSLEGRCL